MSKTERILSFLPSTFRTEPATNVYWLVDVFGQRLQEAESLLVSLMKAHWIDFADRGADAILDLARIAGLANLYLYYPNPACDPTPLLLPVLRRKYEGGREIPWEEYAAAGRKIVWERHEVERFRRFLKRFIRTYLEGPSNIRGLLRVTADTLGVEIDDEDLKRFTLFLTGAPLTSDEAAPLLFGANVWDLPERHYSEGQDDAPASLEGLPLDVRTDLSKGRFLTIAVDGMPAREVDCAGEYPEATFQEEIVQAINTVFSDLDAPLADLTMDGRLRLTSPTPGAGSSIELQPRYLRLQESPPVAHTWETPEPLASGSGFSITNPSVIDESVTEIVVSAVRGIIGPGLRDARTGVRLRARVALMAGDELHIRRDESGAWTGWVKERDASVEVVSSRNGLPIYLRRGASRWWFTECLGARFNAARFGQDVFVAPPCKITGVFDATAFNGALPDEETVFAARDDPPPAPAAHIAFHWDIHPVATFEIRLPAGLPPRYGALFDHARFAVAPEEFCQVVVFPVDAPNALVVRIETESALVSAVVVASPEQPTLLPGAKPSDGVGVLFFEGGADATDEEDAKPASLVLYAEAWEEQAIKLEARRPGEWGNQLTFKAPAILTGGTFNATVALAGAPSVFENAREKVWEAASEAKAAGVQIVRVTRGQPCS